HRLVLPAAASQFVPQHFGDVRLHDDLRVEICAAVEVEVLVSAAGEAVETGMAAPAVRIDRPAERHLRPARNVVERGLREHLVERHSRELGSGDRAHDSTAILETGEGRGVDVGDRLSLPAHDESRTYERVTIK